MLYQQCTAIIAAFALIAFLGHFVDLEWRGAIAAALDQWNEYVRPSVKWLLRIIITVPLGWLGVHIEVPLVIRDYVAVGLVTALSMIREQLRSGDGMEMLLKPLGRRGELALPSRLMRIVGWLPLSVLIWPLTIIGLLFNTIWWALRPGREWISFALALSAELYFAILLGLNYWLL